MIDRSGSMEATDVAPSRLRAALHAPRTPSCGGVPKQVRVGASPSTRTPRRSSARRPTATAVRDKLAALVPSGGTATGDALAAALRAIRLSRARRAPAARRDRADLRRQVGARPQPRRRGPRGQRLKVPVYTVALGTPDGTITVRTRTGTEQRAVPPDP